MAQALLHLSKARLNLPQWIRVRYDGSQAHHLFEHRLVKDRVDVEKGVRELFHRRQPTDASITQMLARMQVRKLLSAMEERDLRNPKKPVHTYGQLKELLKAVGMLPPWDAVAQALRNDSRMLEGGLRVIFHVADAPSLELSKVHGDQKACLKLYGAGDDNLVPVDEVTAVVIPLAFCS